jgi:ParB family chromosome partitioning protein
MVERQSKGSFPIREVEIIGLDRIAEDPYNARKHTTGIDELAASLETVGQIIPIIVRPIAHENGDQTGVSFLLLAGHRRLEAAKQLGWEAIACIVTTEAPADREALEALTENVSRINLTPSDLADAVGRLAGLEVSDEEIARALTLGAAEVTAAKALACAPKAIRSKAAKLAEAHPLTIIQQAALVTYSDYKEDLQKIESVLAYNPEQLDHTIAMIEHRRTRTAAIMALKDSLKGTPILKKFDWNGPALETEPLCNLLSDKGKKLNLTNHKACPGHAAAIEDDGYGGTAKITYWCTDWKANSHAMTAKPERVWPGRDQKQPRSTAAKAAKKTAEEKQQEDANNAAWEAAATVRLDFVKQLCGRKLDNAAKSFVLLDVLTREFYGNGDRDQLRDLSLDRQFCELLTQLCADHEDCDFYQTWRQVHPDAREYLTFLAGQGYALSDIERKVTQGQ